MVKDAYKHLEKSKIFRGWDFTCNCIVMESLLGFHVTCKCLHPFTQSGKEFRKFIAVARTPTQMQLLDYVFLLLQGVCARIEQVLEDEEGVLKDEQ